MTPDNQTKISIQDLNFYYGKFHALKNINLDIAENKVTAFIGPSGCGKSTLLRTLNRMYQLYPGQRAEGRILLDGGNVLGRTRDLNVLGDTKSSLGPQLATLIRPQGLRVTPEEFPERGSFYRSDHFAFAKIGVPAVSIGEGNDFEGRPKGWGTQQGEDYTAHRYHQPSDEYNPDWDLRGAVQLSNIVLSFTRTLAASAAWPNWNKGAEFQRKVRKPAM